MLKIFESATLKLTGWYVLILVITTTLFSGAIYQLAIGEVSGRLEGLELRLQNSPNVFIDSALMHDSRMRQEEKAKTGILLGLLYTNIVVWILGGVGSYWLAKRTLEPIQEMHEAQSRFTSDASHELKTPLSVMKSELELALRDPGMKKADYKEVVSSSLEEVNKLTELTHALLQMSRLEHGNIDMEQAVDISEQLVHVQKLLDPKKRVQIDDSAPAVMQGNESMLRDVCMVVLDNALRYSPADSTVTASIKSTAKFIQVRIMNDGKGISASDLEHIFDPFYRADTSRTSDGATRSYGMGLAVAKKIVDLHGGEISISSKPKGQTTVTISLPKNQ